MTHEVGFVAALCEGDATAAPVFADWLEENGDPRAAFLRLQTELAAWVPDLDRRAQLQRQEREWLERHGPAALLGELLGRLSAWRYEAGLAHVAMDARRFVSQRFGPHGADQLRRGWVRALRLDGLAALRSEVAGTPALEAVWSLDLSGQGLVDGDVRVLLESPHLAGLRELDLSNNALTDASLEALAASPLAERLLALDVRNNELSGAGLRAFLKANGDRPLRRLEAHGNSLTTVSRDALEVWRGEREPTDGVPRRIINSVGMELACIPAGSFLMGSAADEPLRYSDEGPQHRVTLTQPFYLGVYPVTQRQFEAVVGRNPSHFTAARHNGGGPDHPAEQVGWHEALDFCARLSARADEQRAGRRYRLPTEAEWEHACRAGTATIFWWGNAITDRLANFDASVPYVGSSPGAYPERTSRVGAYRANPFGLYDTHGNVWEWCQDWLDVSYYRQSPRHDPAGPDAGAGRVVRGGSWYSSGRGCRSAHRGYGSSLGDNQIGLRVICEPARR